MRTRFRSLLVLLPALPAWGVAAQQSPSSGALRPPVADTGIFAPIVFPEGNNIRRPNGSPGSAYWQQRADYTIVATLDTAQKRLAGTVTIKYTNHSPDTLRFVWMQMDQNLFKPGSVGSLLFAQSSRFGGRGFQGGFEITRAEQVTQGGAPKKAAPKGGKAAEHATSLHTRVDDTMMKVDLASPLAPGGTTTLRFVYAFNIPEHGGDRMGRDGPLYEIAQWYPRMAVYDDVHGWNTDQYQGQGEFYLEYGDIDYAVTVPAGYIVAGTGVLQNPAEVLTADQRARLAKAAKSDSAVAIVTQSDLTSGAARPKKTGTLTWKFHAQNVRDVAWAGSPEYLWDACNWNGVLAQAYYRSSALDPWREAAKMSRFSIKEYSTRWFQYAYPQISAVEGPISGMEYPMLAMEAPNNGDADALYNVITHEIGHMWYPMMVGSDERRYAWMDEGFNTFINTFSEEDYWKRDDNAVRQREAAYVAQTDQMPTAQPIMTASNRYVNNRNLGELAYVKPSIVLLALRNKVLGPEVFDTAFRTYTRRWAFKHPQPADFFRTMEDVSGRDLSWFWRGFFYTSGSLDQAVDSITKGDNGTTLITVGNHGSAVMPVDLQLTLSDGSTQNVQLPVEIWYRGNQFTYPVTTNKPVVKATINPDGTLPDIDRSNNSASAP